MYVEEDEVLERSFGAKVLSYGLALRRWLAAGRPVRVDGEVERIYKVLRALRLLQPSQRILQNLRLSGARQRRRLHQQNPHGQRALPQSKMVISQ